MIDRDLDIQTRTGQNTFITYPRKYSFPGRGILMDVANAKRCTTWRVRHCGYHVALPNWLPRVRQFEIQASLESRARMFEHMNSLPTLVRRTCALSILSRVSRSSRARGHGCVATA
jgi:hypothetical protein